MATPDESASVPASIPTLPRPDRESIPEVRLEAVSGVAALRRRIRRSVYTALGIGVGAGVAGVIAGTAAQSVYREYTGYNPVTATFGPVEKTETEPSPQSGAGERDVIPEDPVGLLGRARALYEDAKDFVKEKVDESALMQKYRELRGEVDAMRKVILTAVDKSMFWGPFILTFLATAYVLSKMISLYRTAFEPIDPEIAKNFATLEDALNRLIKEMEAMRAAPPPSDPSALQAQVEDLARRLADLESRVRPLGDPHADDAVK